MYVLSRSKCCDHGNKSNVVGSNKSIVFWYELLVVAGGHGKAEGSCDIMFRGPSLQQPK